MKSRWLTIIFSSLALAACQPNPNADAKLLTEAAAKYSARELEAAEALADKYISANPPGERLDEAYYLRGLSRFTRGSRPLAAMDFKQAIAKTTRVDLKAKSYRALGDIGFETQDWAAAQKDYETALSLGGGSAAGAGNGAPGAAGGGGGGGLGAANITAINYRIGVCLQSQGQWTKAQGWFIKVVSDNNDPAVKERALARMTATYFSLQFGAFADPANARDLTAELQKAAITAKIDSELREGQFLYLVRSGNYSNWAEAAATRDKLLTKYPLVAIIP